MAEYTDPVAKLLTLQDEEDFPFAYNYLVLGFTPEHIPTLIQMATDIELHNAWGENSEFCSPLHAWRTLGQLRALEAVEPLLSLYDLTPDNDYLDDLARVFAQIGPEALPIIANFMNQPHADMWSVSRASNGVVKIIQAHPASRQQGIQIITERLAQFQENDHNTNGLLISDLVELKAFKSIKIIRQAFEAQRVDTMIQGNLGEVEVDLGLAKSPKQYPFDVPIETFMPEAFKSFRSMLSPEAEEDEKVKKEKPKKPQGLQKKKPQKR